MHSNPLRCESTAQSPAVPGEPSRAPRLVVYERGDPGQREVQAFVNRIYGRHYGARIAGFMPRLLGLVSPAGRLIATAGCRSAGDEPLMLEQYLDMPVESALWPRDRRPVQRTEVREIGHLAALQPAAVSALVRALAIWLHADGCRWVVFTATPRVREIFASLGIELHLLADADPGRLCAGSDHWGSYYEQRPVVCAGNLPEGLTTLMPRPDPAS